MGAHPHPQHLPLDERAFFAKLAALNVAFEAAKVGKPAEQFAQRAVAVDTILDRYFSALSHDFSERTAPRN